MTSPEITDEMVARAARVYNEKVPARMGCVCYWGEEGNPPADCRCQERWELECLDTARAILAAALGGVQGGRS